MLYIPESSGHHLIVKKQLRRRDMNSNPSFYYATHPKSNSRNDQKYDQEKYFIEFIFVLCSWMRFFRSNNCTNTIKRNAKRIRPPQRSHSCIHCPEFRPRPFQISHLHNKIEAAIQTTIHSVLVRKLIKTNEGIIYCSGNLSDKAKIFFETIIVAATDFATLILYQLPQQQQWQRQRQRQRNRHELHEGICIIRLITFKGLLDIPNSIWSTQEPQKKHKHNPENLQKHLQDKFAHWFTKDSNPSESGLQLSHIRKDTSKTEAATPTVMKSKLKGLIRVAALMPAVVLNVVTAFLNLKASRLYNVRVQPAIEPLSSQMHLKQEITLYKPQPQAALQTNCWNALRKLKTSGKILAMSIHICSRKISRGCGGWRRSQGLKNRTLQRTMLLLVISMLWHCTECFHPSVKMSPNTIKTKYGLLRGIVVRSSPVVEAYLGIPYASPPVGSLRFMPPITPSSWKNVRNADRFSPVCPQTVPIPPNGPEALLEVPRARLAQLRRLLPLLKNQSEDCLYLNIYVPYEKRRSRRFTGSNTERTDSPKLATILFIHGESYDWNSGNPYDGSELAASGNVIVVTINFRLGIFGFLKTGGKESAQGNFGLMDLVAGLHWLKENLHVFGGDSQRITLFGFGTGAVLVNILVVSPVANDLVQRAVLISGSALSPWAIQKNPLFVKRRVAEQTGCHGDMLYDDLAPCLRTKSVSELLAVKIDHPRFLVGFAPFVDGTVISPSTDSIGSITLPMGSAIVSTSGIEYANFPKRDLIFCLTSVESYLDLSAQDLEFGFNETRRDRILRTFVRNNFHYHLNEIFAVLKNEYTDWEKAIRNPLSSRDATLSFLSDGHTVASLIKLSYMHSLRGGRTYFLHFKHRSIIEDYPQRTGSVRGEDVPFWLGLPISPLFPYNYTTQEKQISRLMLRYLSNFAKSGNPNQSTVMSSKVDDSSDDHQKDKRSELRFDLDNKILNLSDENDRNLAILYNQRRSNTMHEKRSFNRRRMRSNDDISELGFGDEKDIGSYADEKIPFWDAYDVINQLYLELGNKAITQSHYRGHKLSMWLSLIPQLHRHFNINDQSMRHHQFQDDFNSRDLYDGVVRPQLQIKPSDEEEAARIQTPRSTTSTVATPSTNTNKTKSSSLSETDLSTTECDIDGALFMSEITTTQSPKSNRSRYGTQRDLATAATGLIGNLEVLRRLSGKQFQSYTTALIATVSVGCFLLLLNVLIFAGIYHQREKRARDAKTKEELQDSDTSKNSSILKLNNLGESSTHGRDTKATVLFGEYNCYDEKTNHLRDGKLLIDLPPTSQTTVPLDNTANWSTSATCSASTLDLLKTKQPLGTDVNAGFAVNEKILPIDAHGISSGYKGLEMVSYNVIPITAVMEATSSSSVPPSKRGSLMESHNPLSGGQFDYAVQSSDQMSFKAIEDAVKAAVTDVEITHDDDIPEPPPPPRSYHAVQQQQQQLKPTQQQSRLQIQAQPQPQLHVSGGILRQTGTSNAASSSAVASGIGTGTGTGTGSGSGNSKKRVHIQEISV